MPYSEDPEAHEALTAIEHGLPPTAPTSELPSAGLPEEPPVSSELLRQHAEALSRQWTQVAPETRAGHLSERLESLQIRLANLLRLAQKTASTQNLTPELELLESTRMLEAPLRANDETVNAFSVLPHVSVNTNEALPRVVNLAEGYLSAAHGIWSPDSLAVYVQEAQKSEPLLLKEVTVLPQALKLAQLEYILDRGEETFAAGPPLPRIEESPFSAILHSMRRLNQFEWRDILEPLIAFDAVLREDPSGTFPMMEDETRHQYHERIAELARHADLSELETARTALKLARDAAHAGNPDPRLALRTSHIGYYLFAEGFETLTHHIGYYPPLMERLRSFVRAFNEDFYILGIFTLSLLLIVAIIVPIVPHHGFWDVMGALLLALIPASQGGVDLVNNTVSALMKAQSLPKIDFSEAIPETASTLVVVPSLLISEKQVQELFDELEARYLSNQDRNLHFALLTDLPDSKSRPLDEVANPLALFAARCVDHLNDRYGREEAGSFFLFHRHRIFNSRQGVWMGWERKRGKLLDLNKLLLNKEDNFPLKAGPLDVLKDIRFVITLDSDTQLPRGTAARMIGTMMHPLNQAIVSPRLRIVTRGYGILQPRVGVSVASASRSRLASLYSGETGFDIYTRAVSDVYQDLFGEGIFAGKGIYEVSILDRVLDRRFPRNALLSHDLIEGSYARAGLVTDIEVIDDYPSHYSAHTRRKHRWVRGDWQIAQWLFGSVPDESGRMVANPINNISRWKIFDNLRRSLVEPVTFLLFLLGWSVLPGGALYWTIAVLILLLLPVFVQLGFNLGRAVLKLSLPAARDSFITFAASFGFTLLNLTFLPHHMLLSLDAILRSLSRRYVSGKNLLEWETAAQAESGAKRTPLDIYLQLSPVVALVIAAAIALRDARALFAAAPVLLLWMIAPAVAMWLNSSPGRDDGPLSVDDALFLHDQAQQIWRYFRDFGGAENHWLIPDNVEEDNFHQVRKLSPTNLGMLFNARQAAYELGFITLPEFAEATLGTLATYDRLEKQRGHIYNWYDIETLTPIAPMIVSAVDSGNLAASLYTLRTGALDLRKRPLLHTALCFTADQVAGQPNGSATEGIRTNGCATTAEARERLKAVMRAQDTGAHNAEEPQERRKATVDFVEKYVPWLLPQFEQLFSNSSFAMIDDDRIPTLESAHEYIELLSSRLASASLAGEVEASAMTLGSLLLAAQARIASLCADIQRIAEEADRHADAMEYGFLFVKSRQLLSIGYDGATGELYNACYDLLASEARTAFFIAVAKGDIPQQSWFRLDRSHVLVKGRAALLSWTGTMFEYMMPALWMRMVPDTLITRSLEATVRIQREHVKNIPWGISESGFADRDPQGRYGYQAWGIPGLASKYGAEDGPVISPYSTFLGLGLLRKPSIANLRRMVSMQWTGAYGLYEAADYTNGSEPQMVRSWMAHHLGMSLLALTNLLRNNIVQEWFHATPRVRAAELLLHEKPLSSETLKDLEKRTKQNPAAA